MTSAEQASGEREAARPRTSMLAFLGLCIAVWASMCGIGGGLFAVPVLHYVQRLPLREAVATSLGLVAATSISATLAELFVAESALHWGLVIVLAASSLLGAQLGFVVARRIDARPLKAIFALLLLFVSAQLLLGGGRAAVEGAPVLDLRAREYALAALIGVGAGFVSPLLGIGGGLVAVPALLYGVPALGYLGARACSLAMSVVSSLRSLRLYHGTGLVDTRRALGFAAGAMIGAAVGVRLVYVPGLEGVARRMLGLTLLWVALRFARDAWRGEAKGRPA